ncbi:MAG: hypothetical protein ACC646_13235, partial [Paracoccaceae bacterium]
PRSCGGGADPGFRDGSAPVAVAADFIAELEVKDPPGREMMVVVADFAAREIVWRETRTAPSDFGCTNMPELEIPALR